MALSLPKACGALQFGRCRQDGAPLTVFKSTARMYHNNISTVRPAQLTNLRAERMPPARVFPFDQAWAPSVSAAVSYTNSMRWTDYDLPTLVGVGSLGAANLTLSPGVSLAAAVWWSMYWMHWGLRVQFAVGLHEEGRNWRSSTCSRIPCCLRVCTCAVPANTEPPSIRNSPHSTL